MTDDDRRRDVALFRLAVLGDLIHAELRRGELRRALHKKSKELRHCPDGKSRRIAAKTIQSWLYAYRRGGFDALLPKPRSDKGVCRAIPLDLQRLILDMKREDPGRSVPLIERELVDAGLMRIDQFSESAITRLLAQHGLNGPKLELEVPARHRFVAATCNELWQGDACHGPKLFDPAAGREVRVKIFGLLDDKSRLITHLRADFHERQEDFLRVLHEAVRRRGLPRTVLLDNHGSFTGADARVACAQLGIRLTYARPYDGASKGKIERFWRTLRAHVLDRLDLDHIRTLDDLNVRLSTWVSGEYNLRPHSGLGGRTPLDVFEEDADEIRFVDDHDALEAAFVARIERAVRHDSTCSVRGRTYEVPAHLRGRKVTLCYDVLRPAALWIDDAGTRVPVHIVDATANSRRVRVRPGATPEAPPAPTGLNAVEGALGRLLRPKSPDSPETDDDEEGACASC
jgi:putative transposase